MGREEDVWFAKWVRKRIGGNTPCRRLRIQTTLPVG